MILPDVNILIYAFRVDTPHHAVCRRFLTHAAAADAPFGLSPLTLSALIRITTNRQSYREPSMLADCFAFSRSLLQQPNCRLVEPGTSHWSIFERLCRETETVGPRVSDVWFAALAIEHGCEWVTLDRDFTRFPGLRWRRPDVA